MALLAGGNKITSTCSLHRMLGSLCWIAFPIHPANRFALFQVQEHTPTPTSSGVYTLSRTSLGHVQGSQFGNGFPATTTQIALIATILINGAKE